MPITNAAFRNWLKGGNNMKLSTDSAVLRITHEGITDFRAFLDFDKESIEALPKACAKDIEAITADAPNNVTAEAAVNAANISSIAVRRLLVAMHAAKFYESIGRVQDEINMHYTNVLKGFKEDFDAYVTLKKQDDPDVPLVNDKDKEKKVIKWVPIFEDTLSRTFGSKGPLIYVLREDAAVPSEADDPLQARAHYGSSGSLMEELIKRLPHTGSIYKDDNKTVFMMISKAVTGTLVESTIKSFSRQKDGRGAFQALVSNHAGETKYRSVAKSRLNLLQNVKWNGQNYPLEQHVSNHRTAVDDLKECNTHIGTAIPNDPQRVEYLLESITSQDSSLQADMGNVRANTNNLRSDFEATANHLIEVDPYRRSTTRGPQSQNKVANVSSITFSGRGNSGVDLRWHTRKEFKALTSEQKDELCQWQSSSEGKKELKTQRKNNSKKRKSDTGDSENEKGGWKKKFKKAMKTQNGLSHIMSVLMEEEQSNATIASALAPPLAPVPPPPAVPPPVTPVAQLIPSAAISQLSAAFPALATKVKLQNILKPNK